MAQATIWDSETFSLSPHPTEDGTYDLAASAELSNSNPKETSVHVIVTFEALDPDGTVMGVGAQYEIAALVEGKFGSSWRHLGSDRTSIKDTGDGAEHHIIIQPGYAGFESDETLQPAGQPRGFIARFDGKVPDTFRVCLHVRLENAGGPGDFVEATVSAEYETFTP